MARALFYMSYRSYERLLGLVLLSLIFISFYYIYKIPQIVGEQASGKLGNEEKLSENTQKSTKADASDLYLFPKSPPIHDQIPVLIIACNRPEVTRCLESVLKHKPSEKFPVIVSQDCNHYNTSLAIEKFTDRVLHLKQPDQSEPETLPHHKEYVAYYKIARHYKWAFNQIFNVLKFEQAIIIEDDMEIAPDFFHYFEAFLPILKTDESVFCISAWNDNGKKGLAYDPYTFYRSDFFPGLGWMFRKSFWNEIEPIWPKTYWDDWLRHPDRHKGRGCIRPEISRTFNFGRFGVSGGLYYEDHIGKVLLNKESVGYAGVDIETSSFKTHSEQPFNKAPYSKTGIELNVIDVRRYLKAYYDDFFLKQVYELSAELSSERLRLLMQSKNLETFEEYKNNPNIRGIEDLRDLKDVNNIRYCGNGCKRRFRVTYSKDPQVWGKSASQELVNLLGSWNLMSDIREDCARTSYQGIVTFKIPLSGVSKEIEEHVTVYFAPTRN